MPPEDPRFIIPPKITENRKPISSHKIQEILSAYLVEIKKSANLPKNYTNDFGGVIYSYLGDVKEKPYWGHGKDPAG
jgi:hypothetical protein